MKINRIFADMFYGSDLLPEVSFHILFIIKFKIILLSFFEIECSHLKLKSIESILLKQSNTIRHKYRSTIRTKSKMCHSYLYSTKLNSN